MEQKRGTRNDESFNGIAINMAFGKAPRVPATPAVSPWHIGRFIDQSVLFWVFLYLTNAIFVIFVPRSFFISQETGLGNLKALDVFCNCVGT